MRGDFPIDGKRPSPTIAPPRAPTVGDIQAFAKETGRSFNDALHFLTESPLSTAAARWLSRTPAIENPFPDPFFYLPADAPLPEFQITAGRWAPALPYGVYVHVGDAIRTLSFDQAVDLYETLGRVLDEGK